MRLLVTAGPTREFLDPVRFISNRSSGKMGYAVAAVAAGRGHEVVLVSGPVALPAPAGVTLVPVVSAEDMLQAVDAHLDACAALVMTAAVADWRPVTRAAHKVKKLDASAALALEPTPDILATLRPRKGTRLFVGFAAETAELAGEARRKLAAKGLDLIVANDVSRTDAGFDVDTNQVTFFAPDGSVRERPLMAKGAVAAEILDWLEARVPGGAAPGAAPVRPRAAASAAERLAAQVGFIEEIDRLKTVLRRTLLMDGSRYENDAEHSWHVALMAVLLGEHANDRGLDLGRVVRMLLVHDLVEIDAGDTYCYDEAGNRDRPARERRAADRIYALLPAEQGAELRALWEEFEARATREARFAAALDRVQPLLHNFRTGGVVWREHGITAARVRERNAHVAEGSAALWDYAEGLIRKAVEAGFLQP